MSLPPLDACRDVLARTRQHGHTLRLGKAIGLNLLRDSGHHTVGAGQFGVLLHRG